ncbi:MAG: aldehyde dehydrogenase family protein [Bacteriovoracaceae bacterium]|nr:aldehyde dehydrogenase family protein [Bacteriovoracaceae bacterium]
MNIKLAQEMTSCKNYIDGTWIMGSGEKFEIISPLNGEVVAHAAQSSKSEVDAAIESAQKAFIKWSHISIKDRTQVMYRFRDLLLKKSDLISNTVSIESGKTIIEANAGLMKGIEVLEFALSLQNLDSGSKMEVSKGVHCEYRRQPLGVVASITPFNFPAMVPLWTIPIALTLGNSYIWKPSEKTPLTANLIGLALEEAGLPPGVLTILNGSKEIVDEIISNEKVKAVSFVGSSQGAKEVYRKTTNLGKRALCLGGAKNHIILLPDSNINLAGTGIADSFTGCAGQRCMAASVLLAVGDTDEHIESIKSRALETRCGREMGAIISKQQLSFLNEKIQEAIDKGATVILDGRDVELYDTSKEGFWLGPTILDNVDPNSFLAKEELFGPVLAIIRCENISEAIQIENLNDYGNAASIFTSNGSLAEKLAQEASSAMIGINVGVPVPREPFSFGGIGNSKFGHGDITGINSLNFWSDLKKVTTKWKMQEDHNWMS